MVIINEAVKRAEMTGRSLNRNEATELHLEVLNVHVGLLKVLLARLPDALVFLHLLLAVLFDLSEFFSHVFDLGLELLAALPLDLQLLREVV